MLTMFSGYEPSTINHMLNRRNFLRNTTIATATMATISLPEIVSAAVAGTAMRRTRIEKGDAVLFQGDSITDWGRNHNKTVPNDQGSLGTGYVLLTSGQLLEEHADKALNIYNKGISGNKVYQLAERWDTDCLALKPNILSIHIGVNDFWHTLSGGYKGTIETYIDDYHKLLDRTKQALPNIKLVICEPFGIKGVKAVTDAWYPTFDLYRAAAHDIAKEYDASFVPYQSAFDKALESAPGPYWTQDGVHPSIAGAGLMAKTWMEAVK